MKEVAIVILNFNTQKFLAEFLPSVCATNYQNYRIIVADNASTDNSVEFIKTHYPQVELIVLDQNYGFTGGYNKALAQVKSDYYVLLNSDVQVEPNWLNAIVTLAESSSKIAAIQPKILSYNTPTEFEYAGASGGFIDKYGFPYCRGRIFDTIETDNSQYNDAQPVFWCTGAALFIIANLYHEVGGLDADFFAHMEEIDLCWRLQNRGYEVWVCPNSVVYHVGGGTLQKENPKKTYYNFRNGLILLLKNLPKHKLVGIILIRLFLDHVAAYRFLFQGKFGDFKAIARAHMHFLFKFGYWKAKRNNSGNFDAYTNSLVYKKSIVWQYFKNKKDTFTKLLQ